MSEPSEKRQRTASDDPPTNPLAKRKVALLVAYNGVKYSGLQKNPNVTTVEETLEVAIHKAGGISDENFGILQKISWSRAGRTDKGVHALGQIISVKLVLSPDGLLERINAALSGSDIQVLGMERTSNNLCAHVMCTSREYEYLLPVSVLRQPPATEGQPATDGQPASSAENPSRTAPLSAEERQHLLALFKTYEGTHFFHNFTDGKVTQADKTAQRFMISLDLGEPYELHGVFYIPLRFHGQSFLLHQIRKMVGLLVATFRGDVPSNALRTALEAPRIAGIPMAPSCALTLRRCLYDKYERRLPAERNSIHFPDCEAAKQTFMRNHILPHIAKCYENGEFGELSRALSSYRLDLLRNPSGSEEQDKPTQIAATAEDEVGQHDE